MSSDVWLQISELHSTNLFLFFFMLPRFQRYDRGLTLEVSTLDFLYSGQFTLST